MYVGKCQHVHRVGRRPDRLRQERRRRSGIRVSVRVTCYNARADSAAARRMRHRNRERRSRGREVDTRVENRVRLCRVFDIRDDRCSTLNTARFVCEYALSSGQK